MGKSFVEVCIVNPGPHAEALIGKSKAEFTPRGDDYVLASGLEPTASVTDHLRWLHSLLDGDRKLLRKLQAEGVLIACRIRVRDRSFFLEPEALLLMHRFHLRTVVSFNP